MIIEIKSLFGANLSGRLMGKKNFGQACEILSAIQPGEVVVLDFGSVEYVSASWIDAMLVSLVRRAAEEANNFYLLLADFPANSLDDLTLIAEQNHLPFLVTEGSRKKSPTARLVGQLDPGQRVTLEAVRGFGETTGADLERRCPQEGTKATAWNNRLRDLFEKRLLCRRKQGREQVYSPVVKEIVYG